MNSTMICYYSPQGVLKCVYPESGNACANQRNLRKILTGTSSATSLLAFLTVPRIMEMLAHTVLIVVVNKCYMKAHKGKFVFVLFSALTIAFLVLTIVFATRNENYFVTLKIGVCIAGFASTMLIFEPLWIALRFHCCRGEYKPEAMDSEEESYQENIWSNQPIISHAVDDESLMDLDETRDEEERK